MPGLTRTISIKETEWDILEVLWREWAYSTVKTMLDRMVEKRHVRARRVGNVWEYAPLLAAVGRRQHPIPQVLRVRRCHPWRLGVARSVCPIPHYATIRRGALPTARRAGAGSGLRTLQNGVGSDTPQSPFDFLTDYFSGNAGTNLDGQTGMPDFFEFLAG